MNIGRRTFAFSAASLLTFPASAQEAWPSRPVTLVVPYPPGNATDISGRLLLEPLSAEIGQRLVIDKGGERCCDLKASPVDHAFGHHSTPWLTDP